MATFEEALNEARRRLTAGQFADAEAIYQQLLAAAPQAAPLWHEAGIVQLQAGQAEAARERLEKAVSLAPHDPAPHSNLGVAYRQLGRHADAVDAFRRAASLQPSAPLYSNLGLALKDSGRPDEALAAFDEALRLKDDYATGHFNRGNLLLQIGRLDEAIAAYARTVALDPTDAGAWCKKGVLHYDLAQMDQALACFEQALSAQPNYPEARRNRGIVRLVQGDYARGWPDWEARLDCEGFITRDYRQPRWRGEPLAGHTLLVHAEQGLGDTLHFVRYLPLIEQLGGVKFEVQEALVPLMRQSGFGRFLATPAEADACTLRCPLLSLPSCLPQAQHPFWPGAYLAADATAVERWRARLEAIEGFRVGIVWAGNPDHPHDRFRSVALRAFAPLAEVPGVRLIGLQKGPPCEQVAQANESFEVIQLGEFDAGGGAFLDTAAVMRHLHLVVTVDTAVAHLAGGLGIAVWTALQLSPDWRWTLRGSETPWYPTMRLFRQTQFDDWASVFGQMADALRSIVA